MKLRTTLLALGLLAFGSVAANAQSITLLGSLSNQNPGDITLAFTNAGASNDLLFDLGPANNFYTPATGAALGAGTGPLTGGTTYGVTAYSETDLNTEFAGNALSATTYWAVFG